MSVTNAFFMAEAGPILYADDPGYGIDKNGHIWAAEYVPDPNSNLPIPEHEITTADYILAWLMPHEAMCQDIWNMGDSSLQHEYNYRTNQGRHYLWVENRRDRIVMTLAVNPVSFLIPRSAIDFRPLDKPNSRRQTGSRSRDRNVEDNGCQNGGPRRSNSPHLCHPFVAPDINTWDGYPFRGIPGWQEDFGTWHHQTLPTNGPEFDYTILNCLCALHGPYTAALLESISQQAWATFQYTGIAIACPLCQAHPRRPLPSQIAYSICSRPLHRGTIGNGDFGGVNVNQSSGNNQGSNETPSSEMQPPQKKPTQKKPPQKKNINPSKTTKRPSGKPTMKFPDYDLTRRVCGIGEYAGQQAFMTAKDLATAHGNVDENSGKGDDKGRHQAIANNAMKHQDAVIRSWCDKNDKVEEPAQIVINGQLQPATEKNMKIIRRDAADALIVRRKAAGLSADWSLADMPPFTLNDWAQFYATCAATADHELSQAPALTPSQDLSYGGAFLGSVHYSGLAAFGDNGTMTWNKNQGPPPPGAPQSTLPPPPTDPQLTTAQFLVTQSTTAPTTNPQSDVEESEAEEEVENDDDDDNDDDYQSEGVGSQNDDSGPLPAKRQKR